MYLSVRPLKLLLTERCSDVLCKAKHIIDILLLYDIICMTLFNFYNETILYDW